MLLDRDSEDGDCLVPVEENGVADRAAVSTT